MASVVPDTVATAIPLPLEKMAEFCRKWRLTELSVFGSILRDDFGPESDVDVLINYPPELPYTLFTWVDMAQELEHILKRKVDLHGRRGIERGRNPFRRKRILDSARVIYAA